MEFFFPLWSTSAVKLPALFFSSSAGSPYSVSRPSSRNATLSLSMMVFSLCAMVSVVQCANAERTVFWISASLSMSTDAVASSIIRMRELRSNARPMHRSWRWPREKFAPLSTTSMVSFFGDSSTVLRRPTFSSTSQMATSGCSSKGSRLVRIVPANMNGSCGIIAIFERRRCRPSVLTSTPSMRTTPLSGSTMRNSAVNRLDFPEPVRPQMPSFSPPSATKDRSFRTSGRPGR